MSAGALGEAMTRYFAGEKRETLLFFAVGLAAIAAAAILWRRRGRWRHAAWPLALLAVPELAVAGSVYLRTDGQLAALQRKLASSAGAAPAIEVPRMEQVMERFRVYRGVELVLVGLGALALIAGGRRQGLRAAGLGLAAQAGFLFTLDLVAERRGAEYLGALRGESAEADPHGEERR